MGLRGGAVIAIGLATLAVAATAQAAQLYAGPAGSGSDCTQANPCSLKEALERARSNDELIVTSGTYPLSEPVLLYFAAENVDVHGDFGAPMPRITGSSIGPLLGTDTAGTRVRYLEVVNEAPEFPTGFTCSVNMSVERVVARVSGENASALLEQNDCTVRDSLLLASGQAAAALRGYGFSPGYNGLARNITAIASGPDSVGVLAGYQSIFSPGSYTLDLRNSIAAGAGSDIRATTGAEGAGNVVVANSNFDSAVATAGATISNAGANQTAPPVFINAAGENYREAAGSPTIDAGVADQLGATDFDGNPRVLGAAPDIGAFEFVPPPVVVPPTAQIQSLSVMPHKFGAANVGGAILSANKRKAPIGTNVSYSLSAGATTEFLVERKLSGRKVGKRCVKQTKANRAKKKCPLFKKLKGGFTHSGQAGQNIFKFSGRLNDKALKPGSYRLVGKTGSVSKAASFRIVK
jgi:hypothetical protein